MHRNTTSSLICIILSLLSVASRAQSAPSQTAPSKNELGLVIGAAVTPGIALERGGNIDLNSSLTLGAEYDRHLFGRRTTLTAGIDFFASPLDVKVSQPPSDVSPQYAYLFLTPHVRVKFNADRTLQPWVLFGGGYADFAPTEPRDGNVDVRGNGNTGTLEFGGGVDTKPFIQLKGLPLVGRLPIGARVEVRDFYSGQPNYGLPTISSRQNNILFTGGLVLHF
jgi:hypothetical protein